MCRDLKIQFPTQINWWGNILNAHVKPMETFVLPTWMFMIDIDMFALVINLIGIENGAKTCHCWFI